MLHIVFDLDGVLATGTKAEVYSEEAGWAFEKCQPVQGMIEVLRRIYATGARVKIDTARWEKDREKTEAWLRENDVPYHELHMGKPFGDVYVDDKAFQISMESPEWLGVDYIMELILEAAKRDQGKAGQND